MQPLKLLLVDDHILFRKGLRALLAAQPNLQVVGEAGDGLEALDRAKETQPDVILMDIAMPNCNGLEATHLIKRELPQTHIIILTVCDNELDLFAAIKNGAEGYLLKSLEPEQLFAMLEGLARGEAPIHGLMAAKVLRAFRQSPPNVSPGKADNDLTQRDTEILERVAQGATNKEIAQALGITENTVKIHLHHILEKLHLQNRIQAAVYAMRQRLTTNSPEI